MLCVVCCLMRVVLLFDWFCECVVCCLPFARVWYIVLCVLLYVVSVLLFSMCCLCLVVLSSAMCVVRGVCVACCLLFVVC